MRRMFRAGFSLSRLRFGSADRGIGRLLCGIGAENLDHGAASFFSRREYGKFSHWRCLSTTAADVVSEGGVVEVPLAQTGEGIADCELLRWFVQEGEFVEEFQPLCEVQSDKATIEITSRYKGKVSKVNFMPGSVVKVGETLLELMLDGTCDVPPPESLEDANNKILATPAVRGLARELGIHLEDVPGTGEAGRIMREDVLSFASAKEGMEEDLSGLEAPVKSASGIGKPAPETQETTTRQAYNAFPDDHLSNVGADEVIPVRGFRRTMAKTMTAAAAIPHFHYMEEVCMDALVKLKSDLQARTGVKLTYLPFLIKALSLSLQRYPVLNSTVSQDASEIRCKACHNIGVAMATSGGLAVPNIKEVQRLSVKEISDEVLRLTRLAADNKLAPQDVTGGTITVSNFGAIGGKFGSPILNVPEAVILAVGRIQKVPRFNEHGCVYPASIMSVTWGADHRVVDGATIANFCNEWKDMVEHPDEWLLHLK